MEREAVMAYQTFIFQAFHIVLDTVSVVVDDIILSDAVKEIEVKVACSRTL
jgi:hypothetical protein